MTDPASATRPASTDPIPLPPLGEAAVFLDFDGTLVDLAETPDGVHVPFDLFSMLERLHQRTGGATALVSGRKVSDIDQFLPGFPGPVIGSHGAERRIDGVFRQHEAVGTDELAAVKAEARDWAERQENVLVEDKPVSIVLHFRQAPGLLEPAGAAMAEIVSRHDGYELHHAKMALELHPMGVSKGGAVQALMDGPFAGRTPFAAGDDKTDEAMMEVALAAGGTALKIGTGDSAAPMRLETPSELRALLSAWLERT
ncbi:trehalose-phosphatase [Pseudoroseicyclus tamaricis]|uniref:Trehalose 6-phosphate phosphatase n=1 Tax=Pseudoroseicyclus tamaricis TaxID=2705421 RepID=A0A6B2K1Z8_9RHOB|nr:trehalose-phosphatase [Pseudoroseicyclus tamaricis]NDV00436.1 trehalose-phosphatase [Pseudoroseicyclus tamaricis]